jgi:hypothetical protein
MKGEGTITYAYDAKGLKEVKIVVDSTQNPVKTTTTLYVKNYQYSNDTLTQASFEEGRARYQKRYFLNGDSIQTYYYDYFLKDHLGNTRIILTTERDTTSYIATMEAAYRATESKLFSNIASTSFAWNSMPNESQNIPNSIRYPSGVTVNDSVSKVDYNGTSGQTTGPGLLLKVMSGDAVSLGVQCYYVNNTITTTNSSLNSVLNSLAGGIMGTPTGAAEGTLSGYTSSSGTVYSALTNFLGTNDPAPPTGYPKAYLNWILLDDQFNYVSGSSGAVAAASTTYPANQMNTVAPGGPIVMSKNGYLYVWVSNETQGWDVFFDNFSVQYRQGPVLEENHYYPFGLTMAGISDKAVKTSYAENKYRFNKGSELQNKEFSDGSGLEMYETPLRELDPQLGRWWQIDSKPDYAQSLYSSMGDNPILHNDPIGDTGKTPWPMQVDQRPSTNSQTLVPLGSDNNNTGSGPTTTTQGSGSDKSTGTGNPATAKQTGGEDGEKKPLVSSTNTDKITKEVNLVPGTLGDKVAVSSYSGVVVGKEGSSVTTDASTNNGKPEGGSITLGGILTLGVSRDGSVSAGIGAGGYEGHVSVGFGVGLGQVGAGGSHTENGAVSGGDVTIRPGGGAAIAAAIVLLSPILAF